jgi:hypothetical protein
VGTSRLAAAGLPARDLSRAIARSARTMIAATNRRAIRVPRLKLAAGSTGSQRRWSGRTPP